MSNMLNTGISGLNAAQVALSTVSNNISNTNTPGYSRQVVVQTNAISQSNGRYTIGNGVDVVAVQRAYNDYLTSAVWSSKASLQRATTYNDLSTTLNGALSASGDLQGSLDKLYGAFSAVANAPSSSSGRQALLGSAQALSGVFNTFGQQLDAQRGQVNGQIQSTVKSINSVVANIADLNKQIFQSSGTGQPNALLDQRDALVSTLSGYLGVTAVVDGGGMMSVYSTSGQALVSGSNSFPLSSGGSTYDPTRPDVFDKSGNNITTRLSGGKLGALLDYRSNVLDPVQNKLGQAAVALATSVNAQQAKGLDLNGQQGKPIFSVPAPTVLAANGNQGNAGVAASMTDVSQLSAADYKLSYDGSAWTLQTQAGQSVPLTVTGSTLSAQGLSFQVSGSAQAGDSFQIQPTAHAATGIGVVMTDPSGVAAAAAVSGSPASGNVGSGAVGSISVNDATNPALLSNATVSFTSPGIYQITDGGGAVIGGGAYTAGQPISANGWSLTLNGAPAAGDSFKLAANSNGLNDNSNALTLAGMATTGVLDGSTTSVLASYAQLTTTIGTVGNQAATNLTTQTSLNNQAVSAQQSVAGVNMDEEAANLVRFQQAYQASAQIISASQNIFSSLLSAIQR